MPPKNSFIISIIVSIIIATTGFVANTVINTKPERSIIQNITDNRETPSLPIGSAIEVRIELQGSQTPISPYIYGTNDEIVWDPSYVPKISKPTFVRSGGDDWSTYNWENNATNQGVWWGPNSNTDIEGGHDKLESDTSGAAVLRRISAAHRVGAVALITVPITDYVAADKRGIVTTSASDTNPRWAKNRPTKPTPLSMIPDLTDHTVYQDEFVHFIQETFKDALAQGKKIFYSLGNEPGIWNGTHHLLHPAKTTYAEIADRTKQFGTMIKRYAPTALVFGPVSFGYYEFVGLADAPDQDERDYLNFYLDTAKQLEMIEGKRIMDVLDVHWYPEAKAEGQPIVHESVENIKIPLSANPGNAEIEARVQAPRSLWDPAYVEDSWIAKEYYGKPTPIRLVPWLKEKIDAHYPGTKLAITEYNYGDGNHISHAIAQADVLGIFGREGLFAANFLPLTQEPLTGGYITGAFDMYLNYDGKGSTVGDLSLKIENPDVARLSIYAMKSTKAPSVLHVVAINKTSAELPLNVTLTGGSYKTAARYRLTSASLRPKSAGNISLTGDILSDHLPPLSITTFELRK